MCKKTAEEIKLKYFLEKGGIKGERGGSSLIRDRCVIFVINFK